MYENYDKQSKKRIRELESELSVLKLDMENLRFQLKNESKKHRFYKQISDFAFGWELWLEPDGTINYCSPSCYDLTGFTSNQIVASSRIEELLVYDSDKQAYAEFLTGALSQTLINQTLEFRILTRTKQLRWCMMSVRGVYNEQGKYLGIRASVQDITRLKSAMGHIQELEMVKEFEQRTKHRLQTELELKDRELVAILLQLSQKNELLVKTSNLLQNKEGLSPKILIKQVTELLKTNLTQLIDWGIVENQMEKLYPGFLNRLNTKHPNITGNDKKLCSYIRLGLSSKEIAGLINITPKSVEIARVRLRKKLKIAQKHRLVNYLSEI